MTVALAAPVPVRVTGLAAEDMPDDPGIGSAGFDVVSARHTWTLPRWLPLPIAEFALGKAVKPV